jgi:hypothetical protein
VDNKEGKGYGRRSERGTSYEPPVAPHPLKSELGILRPTLFFTAGVVVVVGLAGNFPAGPCCGTGAEGCRPEGMMKFSGMWDFSSSSLLFVGG